MSSLADKYLFRDEMVSRLHDDLIGPGGGEDEVLTESPLDRYIAGVLWPQDSGAQEEVPDDTVDGGSEDAGQSADTPVSQARMRYPSSAGITFTVDARKTDQVTLTAGAARYLPQEAQNTEPMEGQRSRARRKQQDRWIRSVPDLPTVALSLGEAKPIRHPLTEGLELYTLVRPPVDGLVTVTAALVNVREAASGPKDSFSWFQVSVQATTATPAIVDRRSAPSVGLDEDLDTGALLYRRAYTFASGHGCAAAWDDPGGDSRTSAVRTTFLPQHELLRAKPREVPAADLRMSFLKSADDASVLASLRSIVSDYRAWIVEKEQEIRSAESGVDETLRPVAERHVEQARIAADRIEGGIDHLADKPAAMRSFRLMNESMQAQRARQDWIRNGAKGEPEEGVDQVWRPFQLAFILLNLPGLDDPEHEDRGILDLLWFPTGGGKTEAYLGLIAYTVVRRRLADDAASGVAVIMRYTLRLLTIQQFERATMLLCSLESLRRRTPELGSRPYSIGLWVGSDATPNDLDEARRSLGKLRRGHDVEKGNPMQLLQCPWCGSTLGPDEYAVVDRPDRHLRIACGMQGCDFANGLPVHVVDEDVYRERPELLIGTVDKFARMAWSGKVGALFGRDGGYRPTLIIQDELHLISGPLGSMVGLYETAVEAACAADFLDPSLPFRGRPKVIASTATIRRAGEQVTAVFNRTAAQFPPPGLDPDHSFFAEPAISEELGSRKYVGVMAPGTSHQSLMIRVYASLLQSAQDLPADEATRDPYWTLLGYFGSLRVLGSAHLQVQDDVRTRLGFLAGQFGTEPRRVRQLSELTSRVGPREIPERLKHLEVPRPDAGADDVVLATNMISVGLDVDRLGLMAVMGQPQSSAEYIQATSRVGRKHPGLVVTMFNAARSRDRSHFEDFTPFHQSIYRSVEATSATPFAARARDRGLHGVLTAVVRLLFNDLAPNNGAGLVDGQEAKLERAAAIIADRAHACSDDGPETEHQLAGLVQAWLDAARAKPGLTYMNKNNWEAALLVDPADMLVNPDIPDFEQGQVPWPTLQSLRDVDAESTLFQVAHGRQR
ncbi:helicase-related protein [Geodermatophilus sp. SYSU D00703]